MPGLQRLRFPFRPNGFRFVATVLGRFAHFSMVQAETPPMLLCVEEEVACNLC